MKTLPLEEVRTNLSSLVQEVRSGSEIGISHGRSRDPVAVIIPYAEYKRHRKRTLGSLKGRMRVLFNKDFPMNDDELIPYEPHP